MLPHIRTTVAILLLAASPAAAADLFVGFSEVDITPKLTDERPVWVAGYGPGRKATGVHDPLMARCVVLGDGSRTVALVSTDLVGVQYDLVKKIREQLTDIDYALVASTHNHEGPDVIGIWGKTLAHRGVDDDYLQLVVDRVVDAVHDAKAAMTKVTAEYGTASDASLLRDSRQPIVYDPVLRVLHFRRVDNAKPAGLLVQWNCHPETLGSKNTLITADFPYATVAKLKEKYDCPVAYFSGAVGGLMAPPRDVKDADGKLLEEGDFEYARVYGQAIAALATKAVEDCAPIELTPITVAARAIYMPVNNKYYRTAHGLGVLQRDATVWTGDINKRGARLTAENIEETMAVNTEVAYLRLGELHVAGIPGELYPELVYGEFQEPVESGVDLPDAPLEPTVESILPGDKWLLFGLANDEIGYIIPQRQWDFLGPFAYGRSKRQYGEINSCGPDIAPLILGSLKRCVEDAD